MKRSLAKRMAALLCICALLVTVLPAQPVFAESLAEKISRLKGELEEIDENIENLSGSIGGYEALKSEYAAQQAKTEELLAANAQSLQETQDGIDAKQAEIAQKRQVIYENEQLFQERLIAIYKMNTANPITTLLSVNSFAELLTVSSNLKSVTKHDTDLLDMLATQRAELETELGELDVLLAEFNQKQEEYNGYINQLANSIAAQDQAISAAEAAIAAQETAREETYEELEAAQEEQRQILARLKTQGSTSTDGSQFTGGTLAWPVPGFYNISCEFGSADPNGAAHRGMDIAGGGIQGAPIVAGHDGVVLVASTAHYSYGNYVVIDHGGGLKSLYAHCESLAVSVGQTVTREQVIGYVGSTGFSTGYHLHLEVHFDGALQNPRAYLSA